MRFLIWLITLSAFSLLPLHAREDELSPINTRCYAYAYACSEQLTCSKGLPGNYPSNTFADVAVQCISAPKIAICSHYNRITGYVYLSETKTCTDWIAVTTLCFTILGAMAALASCM